MKDSTRQSVAPAVPDELRADVRLLGSLLGMVIAEAGGEELLADVEKLRTLTIAAYGGDESTMRLAEDLVESFSAERATLVARAFTCYFHLVNAAEEHHRVRALRRRVKQSQEESPAETFKEAFDQLSSEIGYGNALAQLEELEFRPVFTAHPTEVRRRAVFTAIRRISTLLAELDDPRVGGGEAKELHRRLLEEINVLWRTAPVRTSAPTPVDEVRTVMSIFDTTLFEQLPQIYRRFDSALQPGLTGTVPPLVPAFLKLGTWIGGDRDGNPNVTAKTTREASIIAAEHILLGLEKHARRLGRELTLDAESTPPSAELQAMILRHWDMDEGLAGQVEQRSPGAPHRQALLFLAERIRATRRRDADLAYAGPEEFVDDLLVVQSSLADAGDLRSAYGELQHLVWQAESFGFHLAELEVRQHSQVHREALAEIRANGINGNLSARTQDVLETLRAIGRIQRRFGPKAARRYIVSFTQSVDDIAAVYELAELATGGNAPTIDVIPLFETFNDLRGSVAVLDAMQEVEHVQRRLAENGRRLEVMLGYSDSSKDVGPVSAILALYDAQARLTAWAQERQIRLTLFHGRGGALGRGGGPAGRAVLSQPPGSVDGRFKVTEQGEVIFARYGDPAIASRHVEQVAAAILLTSAPSLAKRNSRAAARYTELANELDTASRRRFLSLVRAPGFAAWFAHVTPLDELGLLALGSRPAKRGLSVNSLDDLRAIPWVFAWTQTRINLTGWYGLGTALAAVNDLGLLQEAYQDWPLFTAMINNVEMSLAKTDERIARRYLALGERDDLTEAVLSEMELTRQWVLNITGHSRPLESTNVLGPAVQLRSPYVDALSLIQLRALRRLREGQPNDDVEDLNHLLLLSVNGVAAGLQNTG